MILTKFLRIFENLAPNVISDKSQNRRMSPEDMLLGNSSVLIQWRLVMVKGSNEVACSMTQTLLCERIKFYYSIHLNVLPETINPTRIIFLRNFEHLYSRVEPLLWLDKLNCWIWFGFGSNRNWNRGSSI